MVPVDLDGGVVACTFVVPSASPWLGKSNNREYSSTERGRERGRGLLSHPPCRSALNSCIYTPRNKINRHAACEAEFSLASRALRYATFTTGNSSGVHIFHPVDIVVQMNAATGGVPYSPSAAGTYVHGANPFGGAQGQQQPPPSAQVCKTCRLLRRICDL